MSVPPITWVAETLLHLRSKVPTYLPTARTTRITLPRQSHAGSDVHQNHTSFPLKTKVTAKPTARETASASRRVGMRLRRLRGSDIGGW